MKRLTSLLAILLAAAAIATAAPAGATSEWGIVIAPCAWCDGTNSLEVHHVYPQHLWPERARDTNNMVCLCRRCHLALGHRGNFKRCVTNLLNMIKEGRK
jgi:cytochrome c553